MWKDFIRKNASLLLPIFSFIFILFWVGVGEQGGWFISRLSEIDKRVVLANPLQSLLHQVLVDHVGNGFHHSLPESETFFLSGIKQRLLSFIFRGIWNEETDQTMVSKSVEFRIC